MKKKTKKQRILPKPLLPPLVPGEQEPFDALLNIPKGKDSLKKYLMSLSDDEAEALLLSGVRKAGSSATEKDVRAIRKVIESPQLYDFLADPNAGTQERLAYRLMNEKHRYPLQDTLRNYNRSFIDIVWGESEYTKTLAAMCQILYDQSRFAVLSGFVLFMVTFIGQVLALSKMKHNPLIITKYFVKYPQESMATLIILLFLGASYSIATGMKVVVLGTLALFQEFLYDFSYALAKVLMDTVEVMAQKAGKTVLKTVYAVGAEVLASTGTAAVETLTEKTNSILDFGKGTVANVVEVAKPYYEKAIEQASPYVDKAMTLPMHYRVLSALTLSMLTSGLIVNRQRLFNRNPQYLLQIQN